MNDLVELAKLLGLSGVGVGVFFLLIKGVIEKKIYPELDRERAYRILRTIIYIVFAFSSFVLVAALAYEAMQKYDVKLSFASGSTHVSLLMTRERYALFLEHQADQLDEPGRRRVQALRADIDQAYDDLQTSTSTLVSLLRSEPKWVDADAVGKAAAEAGFGRSHGFREIFERLAHEASTPQEREKVAEIGFWLGRFQELTADYETAKHSYREALRLSPHFLLPARALASLKIDSGDMNGALDTINSVATAELNDVKPVHKAEALTKRAEIYMWLGRFQEASHDLESAIELAGDGNEGTDGPQMPLASLLNSSAGVWMQLGEFNKARGALERALVILASADKEAHVNALTNLCGLLSAMGDLRGAQVHCEAAKKLLSTLRVREKIRGFLYVNLARLQIRTRDIGAGRISLSTAEDIFIGPHEAEGALPNTRLTIINCLRQRLYYLDGRWGESRQLGLNCISQIKRYIPGRIDDFIYAVYYLVKSDIKLGDFNSAGDQLNIAYITTPENSMSTRLLALTKQAARLIIVTLQSKTVTEAKIDEMVQSLARVENLSGILTDTLTDLLLLRSTGSIEKDHLLRPPEINRLRASYGAKTLELPLEGDAG